LLPVDANHAVLRWTVEVVIEILVLNLPWSDPGTPPRRADFIGWARHSANLSKQLRNELRRGGDWFHYYDEVLVKDRALAKELTDLYRDAGGTEYARTATRLEPRWPDPSPSPPKLRETNDSELYSALLAFEGFCRFAVDHTPRDRGGRGDLEVQNHGSPRWRLVRTCIEMFGIAWPNDLSPAESSRLYSFCAGMVEMVTGKDVEVRGTGIRHFVAFGAPLERRLKELGSGPTAGTGWQREPFKGCFQVLSTKEREHEISEIHRKLSAGPARERRQPTR